ncbi:MAG: MATE family efflux transporter [Spirochaetaceae bacterium]
MIKDLTNGSIIKNLLKVSLPVMAASMFQMAYQIIDMYWLGKLSSDSVAAVGTAGFYINLSYAIATLAFIGAGIKVSHAVGEKRYKDSIECVFSSLFIILVLSFLITTTVVIFRKPLIGFFNIKSTYIYKGAIDYLTIVISFSIFKNLNLTFNRIFIGYGSGRIPLIIGSLSLILNIVLDPILIFKFNMGIKGAAYATVIAQTLSAIIYVIVFIKSSNIKSYTGLGLRFDKVLKIVKLSYPVAIQRVTFTTISIMIGKIISNWGTDAIAIQKIGIQLESISWVTAAGMQAAITSFIGQNYGAKKFDRLKKGYISAISIMGVVGIIVSAMFFIFPREIFSLFVQEESVIQGGIVYLRILSISQIFMCIEITTMGAFNGIGKTGIPPIVSVSLTASRIPLSILLATVFGLGVSGVWYSISVTTIFKGIILTSLFFYFLKKIDRGVKI